MELQKQFGHFYKILAWVFLPACHPECVNLPWHNEVCSGQFLSGQCRSALQFPRGLEDSSPNAKLLVFSRPGPSRPFFISYKHRLSFPVGSCSGSKECCPTGWASEPRQRPPEYLGFSTLLPSVQHSSPGKFTQSPGLSISVTAVPFSSLTPRTRIDAFLCVPNRSVFPSSSVVRAGLYFASQEVIQFMIRSFVTKRHWYVPFIVLPVCMYEFIHFSRPME